MFMLNETHGHCFFFFLFAQFRFLKFMTGPYSMWLRLSDCQPWTLSVLWGSASSWPSSSSLTRILLSHWPTHQRTGTAQIQTPRGVLQANNVIICLYYKGLYALVSKLCTERSITVRVELGMIFLCMFSKWVGCIWFKLFLWPCKKPQRTFRDAMTLL